MDTYDLQTPDSYAVHLAELNTSKGVTASRDILNTDGTLLVAKGHPIKAETVQRLLNHKLTQPLETSIDVADAISPQQLFDDITSMLRGDKECLAIHQALDLDEQLRKQCQLYGTFPLVTQKMTVLSSRLPHEYAKATFCAWFCLVLAVQMGNDGRGEAFLAGLTHDTGLLHIDPAIVNKTGSYTPEEWREKAHWGHCTVDFAVFVGSLVTTGSRLARTCSTRSIAGPSTPRAMLEMPSTTDRAMPNRRCSRRKPGSPTCPAWVAWTRRWGVPWRRWPVATCRRRPTPMCR